LIARCEWRCVNTQDNGIACCGLCALDMKLWPWKRSQEIVRIK
jgi:hypothetical protein